MPPLFRSFSGHSACRAARAALVAVPGTLSMLAAPHAAAQIAVPSAIQRWFRSDLPQPAPNPFGLPPAGGPLRAFPERSLLGSMTPGVFPLVSINGTDMRFAAGAVIRNQSNLVVLPATLSGSTWPVRYVLDPAGHIAQAWILTDAELDAEAKRPRTAAGSAAGP